VESLGTVAREKIVSFIKKKHNIYIYGAGKYGGLCLNILHESGAVVLGFIETEPNKKIKNNIPVYSVRDICDDPDGERGIIVAAKNEYGKEMVQHIPVGVPYLCLSDEEWYALSHEGILAELEQLSGEFPNEPEVTPQKWQNILVVRLDAIGDMIWTTAFLRELKSYCSNANITLIIRPELYTLMKNCPYIDHIGCFDCAVPSVRDDYDNLRRDAAEYINQHLKGKEYDAVFLPRVFSEKNLLENLYLAIYSGAKQRIGIFDNKTPSPIVNALKKLFSVAVNNGCAQHEVDRILGLLSTCNIPVRDKKLELWPGAMSVSRIAKMLESTVFLNGEKKLLISVGLVSRDGNRTWPAERFAQLFEKIVKTHQNVIFILCGGNDASGAALKVEMNNRCINFVGKTSLDETTALLGMCDFYLGVNTGLLHIAVAMGKPVVEISGQWPGGNDDSGLSPVRVGAFGVESIVVQPKQAMDEHCAKAGYCKRNEPHCICQVSVEDVENAVSNMIHRLEKRDKKSVE